VAVFRRSSCVSLPSAQCLGWCWLVVAASDDAGRWLPDFTGAEEEAACLFRPEGAAFCLASQ